MADIFISYKREERRYAERLSIALEQLGFDVWWDFELLSGEKFRRVIEKVIDQCGAAVVLWSVRARDSLFVVDEASYANDQGKLCPARIEECRPPLGFGGDHVIDLSDWDGEMRHEGFQALLRALEAKTGKKAKFGAPPRTQRDEARYAEMEAFKAAQAAENRSALRAFLRAYPKGVFASFVRGQLDELESAQRAKVALSVAAAAAPAPAPPPPRPDPPPSGADPFPAAEPPPPRRTEAPAMESGPPRLRVRIFVPALATAMVVAAAAAFFVLQRPGPQAPETERAAPQAPASLSSDAGQPDAHAVADSPPVATDVRADAQSEEPPAAAAERTPREEAPPVVRSRPAPAPVVIAPPTEAPTATPPPSISPPPRATEPEAAPPATFSLAALHPEVRVAAQRARDYERRAGAAAARARQAAEAAVPGSSSAWVDGTAPQVGSERGVAKRSGTGRNAGDQYAGELARGLRNGVGVYAFATNSGNSQGSLSYEGEWRDGQQDGVGVYVWRNGARYAGGYLSGDISGYGVYTFPDGRRYEGAFAGGRKNGFGALWDPQGRAVLQGRWSNDRLAAQLTP